jgi:hypothetical protein
MANPQHIEILKQGVEVWNRWRNINPQIIPDIGRANLQDAELSNANFVKVNFLDADLRRANLDSACLMYADLGHTNLSGASLNGTDLRNAILGFAFISGADLSSANLHKAYLRNATLKETYLEKTDFNKAQMSYTTISGIDLSKTINLDSVSHSGPSSIDIQTIYKSHGDIPDIFLRGCGLPEAFIVQIPALVAAIKPIQFYSCFISYSSKDEEFVKRLYADLQSESVRCWFAPEDLKIGEKFRVRIDESIRLYDKLLLVLSENSVASEWVEKEVETAFEKEREQKKTVLFPVRLDDAVMDIKTGWAADIRKSRHIGDFRDWKNHDSYRKAFERLMRDLKAEAGR